MSLAILLLLQAVCWSVVVGAGNGRALALPGSGSGELTPAMMMPTLVTLDVKCSRSGMAVTLVFDSSFNGVIYSKGHFYDTKCHYVTSSNTGAEKYVFNVPIDGCGTTGQLDMATRDRDMFFENTLVLQNDPLITEVWDQARAIRCTWQHTIQKSVDFTPFQVYEPKKVPVQLDARSVNTLMEIQKGSSPFAHPATGYVYMGEDTSIVIYIQDPKHELDANVISCSASSAGGSSIELLDDKGCVVREDLLTTFTKTRETNGVIADLMLYSYLKAFKIGESPEFVISCELEVCAGKCAAPCSGGNSARSKRHQPATSSTVVQLERGVLVVTKQELEETACWLDSTVLVSMMALISIVMLLSVLSCFLAHKVSLLRGQVNPNKSGL